MGVLGLRHYIKPRRVSENELLSLQAPLGGFEAQGTQGILISCGAVLQDSRDLGRGFLVGKGVSLPGLEM